ncbi:MAG TPA: hypothetical protein VN939_21730 [Chthoniobacterales bacterium]|jgi:hypothetical protein|nr:hypothetical protein [Chthoniobacterales bacterium]
MIFYHKTSDAEAVLRYGFRDAERFGGPERFVLRGVLVSDVPLACMEGEKGSQVLKITFPDEYDISEYELLEEGKRYREWCVPSELINILGQVELWEDIAP